MERRYQTIKQQTNTLLDRTRAPSFCWMLDMCSFFFILNHTWNRTIKITPLQASTGSTYDISRLSKFAFWKPIYFSHDDPTFGSYSPEECSHFLGMSVNVDHVMIFKILKDDTQKIIFRSNVRPGNYPISRNFRIGPTNMSAIIKSRQAIFTDGGTISNTPSTISDDDIYQDTFLMPLICTSNQWGDLSSWVCLRMINVLVQR